MRASKNSNSNGGLVYSSDTGRLCPDCGAATSACICPKPGSALPAPGDSIVRVGRETKGRKGAGVTVVTGVALGAPELTTLATRLKKRCGSGGTVKDGTIEIQGDHRETVAAALREEGWRVKIAGG